MGLSLEIRSFTPIFILTFCESEYHELTVHLSAAFSPRTFSKVQAIRKAAVRTECLNHAGHGVSSFKLNQLFDISFGRAFENQKYNNVNGADHDAGHGVSSFNLNQL